MSTLFSIIFAPTFVIALHFFAFKRVTLFYLVFASVFFIYSYIKKSKLQDMVMPSIYLMALAVAYYFSSLQTVKYIPVTLSLIFLVLFIDSHYNKREMVLGFTKKFYPKELSNQEVEFLKKGDVYWVGVMFINTLIHLYVVNFTSDVVWAFYTSIGWYILFFIALITQILYGKYYAVKMYYR